MLKIRQELTQQTAIPSSQGKPTPTAKTPTPARRSNSLAHTTKKTTPAKRTPRPTIKRSNETENTKEKRTKSPNNLFTEPLEQPPQPTSQQEINTPPFGTYLVPGPSKQHILVPMGNQHTVKTTKEQQTVQINMTTTTQEDLGHVKTMSEPNVKETKAAQEDQTENRKEEHIAKHNAGNQPDDQDPVRIEEMDPFLFFHPDEQMEQATDDTTADTRQGYPTPQ
jgi:hypothetical protein